MSAILVIIDYIYDLQNCYIWENIRQYTIKVSFLGIKTKVNVQCYLRKVHPTAKW